MDAGAHSAQIEAVLLRNGVVIVDKAKGETVRVVLHVLLVSPFAVAVELGGVGPGPGLVAAGIDFVEGSFAFGAYDFEHDGGVLEGRFVVGEIGGERVGGAADACGGADRVDVVSRKTEHPHDAAGGDFGEDFVEAGIVIGNGGLRYFTLK